MLSFKTQTLPFVHTRVIDPPGLPPQQQQERIKRTTVVAGARSHRAILTNYPCLGRSLNSIFNLHSSISRQSVRLTTIHKKKCTKAGAALSSESLHG